MSFRGGTRQRFVRCGYVFRMGLPTESSSRARSWICYAYPLVYGVDGAKEAYVVDQDGDVLGCRNESARYSGLNPPDLRAATRRAAQSRKRAILQLAANEVGLDGARWTLVN